MQFVSAPFQAANAAGQVARDMSNDHVIAALSLGPSVFPLLKSGITQEQFADMLRSGINEQRQANEEQGVIMHTGLNGHAYRPALTPTEVKVRQPQPQVPLVEQQQIHPNQQAPVNDQVQVAQDIGRSLAPAEQRPLAPKPRNAVRSTPRPRKSTGKQVKDKAAAKAPVHQVAPVPPAPSVGPVVPVASVAPVTPVPPVPSTPSTPLAVNSEPGKRGRGRPRKHPIASNRGRTPLYSAPRLPGFLTAAATPLRAMTPTPTVNNFMTPQQVSRAMTVPATAPPATNATVPSTNSTEKRPRPRSTSLNAKKRIRQRLRHRRAGSEESMSSGADWSNSSPMPFHSDASNTDIEMQNSAAGVESQLAHDTGRAITPAPTRKSSRPHTELNYMQQIEEVFAGLSDPITSSDAEPESEVGKGVTDNENSVVGKADDTATTGTAITPEDGEAATATSAPAAREGNQAAAKAKSTLSIPDVTPTPKRKYSKRAKADKDSEEATPSVSGKDGEKATPSFPEVAAKPKRKYTKRANFDKDSESVTPPAKWAKVDKESEPVITPTPAKKRGRPPKDSKTPVPETQSTTNSNAPATETQSFMTSNAPIDKAQPTMTSVNSDEVEGTPAPTTITKEVPKTPTTAKAPKSSKAKETAEQSSSTSVVDPVGETPKGSKATAATTSASTTTKEPETPKGKKAAATKSAPETPSKYMVKKAASIPVKPRYTAIIARVRTKIGRGKQYKYLVSFSTDDDKGIFYTQTKMKNNAPLKELMDSFDATHERVDGEDVKDVRFTGQEEGNTAEKIAKSADDEVTKNAETNVEGKGEAAKEGGNDSNSNNDEVAKGSGNNNESTDREEAKEGDNGGGTTTDEEANQGGNIDNFSDDDEAKENKNSADASDHKEAMDGGNGNETSDEDAQHNMEIDYE